MPHNPQHKERIRQRILFEAAAAVRAEGPEEIGVAAIMAKAGLTHGGFYAYFRSKDDLLAQAITEIFDERYAWLLNLTERYPPDEALVRFIDGYLASSHRDELEQSCALPTLASYVPRLSEACRARFAEGRARVEAAIAAMLTKLGREQARDLAASALAILVGAIILARTVPDKAASDALLRTARSTVKQQLGLGQRGRAIK
jgi:TetR/AcrR family transcriptional regulator, transcriptional repressor for nem operon